MEHSIITARTAKVAVPYREGKRKGNNGEFDYKEIFLSVAVKLANGKTKWVFTKVSGRNAEIIRDWATAPSKKDNAKDGDIESRFVLFHGYYDEYEGEQVLPDFDIPVAGKRVTIKGYKTKVTKTMFVVANDNTAIEFLDKNPNPKKDGAIEQNLEIVVDGDAEIADGATVDFSQTTPATTSAPAATDANGMPCLF